MLEVHTLTRLLHLPANVLASSVVNAKKLNLPLRRNSKTSQGGGDALAELRARDGRDSLGRLIDAKGPFGP